MCIYLSMHLYRFTGNLILRCNLGEHLGWSSLGRQSERFKVKNCLMSWLFVLKHPGIWKPPCPMLNFQAMNMNKMYVYIYIYLSTIYLQYSWVACLPSSNDHQNIEIWIYWIFLWIGREKSLSLDPTVGCEGDTRDTWDFCWPLCRSWPVKNKGQ